MLCRDSGRLEQLGEKEGSWCHKISIHIDSEHVEWLQYWFSHSINTPTHTRTHTPSPTLLTAVRSKLTQTLLCALQTQNTNLVIFSPAVSDVKPNIIIFQGIVLKSDIPGSWRKIKAALTPKRLSAQCHICNLLVADVFEFLHLGVVTLLSQTGQSLRQLQERKI